MTKLIEHVPSPADMGFDLGFDLVMEPAAVPLLGIHGWSSMAFGGVSSDDCALRIAD